MVWKTFDCSSFAKKTHLRGGEGGAVVSMFWWLSIDSFLETVMLKCSARLRCGVKGTWESNEQLMWSSDFNWPSGRILGSEGQDEGVLGIKCGLRGPWSMRDRAEGSYLWNQSRWVSISWESEGQVWEDHLSPRRRFRGSCESDR